MYNPPKAWATTPPVERAAHLFSCFYAWRARENCTEEGITDAEMMIGAQVAADRRESRSICRAVHGDPAYGATNCDCAKLQRDKENLMFAEARRDR